jgi:CTP:phosphocholine cytidylyltransferase-like protein
MINALILAPEITRGMKSLGSKALLEIKKKISVIEYQIHLLKNICRDINITAITGFESEKIIPILEKHNINYIYNQNYKNTNQSYSLKIFLQHSGNIDNLLVINNGILFKEHTIKKQMLTGKSKIFLLNKTKENFLLGCSAQKTLEYIFYDLPESWSECIFFNKNMLDLVNDILDNNHVNNMYLFEIINSILSSPSALPLEKVYIDKKNIMKINSQKDLNKAKIFI